MTQPCLLSYVHSAEKPDIWKTVGVLSSHLATLAPSVSKTRFENASSTDSSQTQTASHDELCTAFMPSAFGLQNVTAYLESSVQVQNKILSECAKSVLSEAYAIELSGMFFASKMVQNAGTIGERVLYSQFSAQESEHFLLMEALLGSPCAYSEAGAFPQLLARTISDGSAASLVFLIQVVLEGWGITHYRHLLAHAQNTQTKQVFKKILQDEIHHHGSGVNLCRWNELSPTDQSFIFDVSRNLLQMVQVGPQSVLEALSLHVPNFSEDQVGQALRELRFEETTAQKLQQLKRLMALSANSEFIQKLEAERAFSPFSAEAVANCHFQIVVRPQSFSAPSGAFGESQNRSIAHASRN